MTNDVDVCLNCGLAIRKTSGEGEWYAHPDEDMDTKLWHACCPGSREHLALCPRISDHSVHCSYEWVWHRPSSAWQTLPELLTHRQQRRPETIDELHGEALLIDATEGWR